MRPGSFLVARPGFGVLVVALGTLVVPFDSSVNFAFPYITRAFGLPIPAIQWVVIAYTLTYAALMLVFGRVGDMLGYRRIFLAGSGWSAIAFVLCAMAPSYGALLAARVTAGGRLHLATDWAEYAEHMLAVLDASAQWRNLTGTGKFSPRPPTRIETHFERRGVRLGHGVWDLLHERS